MKQYQPGDIAPCSGIYVAVHPHHRLVHQVTMTKGQCLPQCRICGLRVIFQMWKASSSATDNAAHKMLVPFSLESHGYDGLAV